MMTTQMFDVIPWKMTLVGHCVQCYADSSHDPDWSAAPEAAAVTAIEAVERNGDVWVIMRVDLSPQEALILSFTPGTYPFLAHVLHGSRLRLWVNDLGGIEITDMDKYLRIVRDSLKASAGLAVGTYPATDILQHLDQMPGNLATWEVVDDE